MVVGLILGLTYQEKLQRRAFSYLAEQIEQQTGYQIECGEIHFSFPWSWHVDKLALYSADAPVLKLEHLDAHISPWEWLHKHAVVDAIKIQKLILSSLPAIQASSTPLTWESVPWYCCVHKCVVEELHLEKPVVEMLGLTSVINGDTPLHVNTHGVINPLEKDLLFDLAVAKMATPQHETRGVFSLTQMEPGKLTAQLRVTESDGGMLSEYLSLPKGYSFQGIVEATGASQLWANFFSTLSVQQLEGLKGDLQISYESTTKSHYGFIKGPFDFQNGRLEISNLEGLLGPLLVNGHCSLAPDGDCTNTALQITVDDTAFAQLSEHKIAVHNAKIDCILSGHFLIPNVSVKLSAESIDLPL